MHGTGIRVDDGAVTMPPSTDRTFERTRLRAASRSSASAGRRWISEAAAHQRPSHRTVRCRAGDTLRTLKGDFGGSGATRMCRNLLKNKTGRYRT